MSNTHMEQTASAVNADSTTEKVPPHRDLEQAYSTAQQLEVDAESLGAEIDALWYDIGEIVGDEAVPSDSRAALDAASDAVTWLSRAIDNVNGELQTLVSHLQDALDTWSTN
jgi:hypothetical protein